MEHAAIRISLWPITATHLGPAFVLGTRTVLAVRGKAHSVGGVEVWSAKSS